MAETRKSHARRLRENWFEKYAPPFKSGIDLGCGKDPLNDTFRRWDQIFGDGDAQKLEGVPDNSFHTVYCMAEESPVLTKSGFKKIQDVKQGDLVWTHQKRWKKVKQNNKFSPQKELILCKTGSNPIGMRVTKNHPILMRNGQFLEMSHVKIGDVFMSPTVDYCDGKEVIDLADCLKENELVKKYKRIFSIRKRQRRIGDKTLANDFGLSRTIVRGWIYHKKKPYGYFVDESTITFHSAKNDVTIPRYIKIDKSLMRLLGYFLADGGIASEERLHRAKERHVGFFFHTDENHYLEDVKNIIKTIFGILPTDVRKVGKCLKLRYASNVLHEIFRKNFCNKKCSAKEIPSWALWQKPDLQMDLIEGFRRGDGTQNETSVTLNTVSWKLAEGLRLCLIRNGIFASLGKTDTSRIESKIKFREVQGCGYIFYVKWTKDRVRKVGGYVREDVIFSNVKKVEIVKSLLPVYGLEVEEDESYYASNIMHHNSSHILEHVYDPVEALRNWYRVCRSPGHVIVCVPHRDLYEKKKELPSRWNGDHKTFWLPDKNEAPCTRSLRNTILQAIPNANIVVLRVLDAGWVSNGPTQHSGGEYSIEAIIRK